MEPIQFLYIILVGFGAAFVQRVSGFGLGIFTMMFLPHMLPTHTAAAVISCIFSCYTTTFNAIRYRKNIIAKIPSPKPETLCTKPAPTQTIVSKIALIGSISSLLIFEFIFPKPP